MTEERLVDKLRKILALTSSPVEGEATAAAEHLQRLLTAHNLSIADLEHRGQKAPGVRKEQHDLGKAAFKWKLDLAEVLAEHYYCWPLIDRSAKTVAFVGRPENVESLQMLYAWVIDQIKRISAEERRAHWVRTNEHVDPLRWQVNFGLGATGRLRQRLAAIKEAQAKDATTTALVVHHKSEISDWLEQHHGYRVDGQDTAQMKRWREEYAANEARLEGLRVTDIEAFYRERPWERPEAIKKRAEEDAKANAEWERKERKREAARRKREKEGRGRAYRPMSEEAQRKDDQGYEARSAGRRRGDDVNLQPFIEGGRDGGKAIKP